MNRNPFAPFLIAIAVVFFRCLSCARSPHDRIPINIINLDKDTVRWDTVTRELFSKGVPPRRIVRLPAVYGAGLSRDELRANATALARTFGTPGMIGCYLSHRRFWEQTFRGNEETVPWQIVLEDDVIVVDNFCELIEESIDELQRCAETKDKWDVLLLGAFGPIHPRGWHGASLVNAIVAGGGRRRRRVTKHCQIPYRPFGTHAYVLSRRGAEKILRKAWFATGHVDATVWGIRDLFLLSCDPMLAYQDMDSPSTIGGRRSSLFPKSLRVDEYSRVSVEWALNEPLVRVPGLGIVVTIGQALFTVLAGIVFGLVLSDKLPWLLPTHLAFIVALCLFLRKMHIPVGLPTQPTLHT